MKPIVWIVVALVLSLLVGGYALRSGDEVVVPVAAPVPAPVTPVAEPTNPEPQIEPEPVVEALGEAVVTDGDDGILRIDLTNNASFFALFDELGVEDVEGKLARWGLSRGYPQLDDQGNPILDQPYEQYDNATLLAFAEGDDMWAQQFLAERLADTDPEKALEWYRRAAVNGSVHAMTQMARLYRDLQFDNRQPAAAAQTADGRSAGSLKDPRSQFSPPPGERLDVTGYAWAAVAERAGWDPLRGGMTAGFVGAKLSDAQRERACEKADEIFESLVSTRGERGLGGYPTNPPPVVFDPGAVTGTGCGTRAQPIYETQCREVQVNVGGQVSRLWTCDEPGS